MGLLGDVYHDRLLDTNIIKIRHADRVREASSIEVDELVLRETLVAIGLESDDGTERWDGAGDATRDGHRVAGETDRFAEDRLHLLAVELQVGRDDTEEMFLRFIPSDDERFRARMHVDTANSRGILRRARRLVVVGLVDDAIRVKELCNFLEDRHTSSYAFGWLPS